MSDPKSFKVASTLAAYRIVAAATGAAYTVEYPAGIASWAMIGITTDTVKDTVNAIPVATAGQIAKLYFNDSCATGCLVTADSSGRGVAAGAASTSSFYVGVLIGPTVQATGTIAEVLVNPGMLQLG